MHGIITELLSQLTKELRAYLGQASPRLSDNWWKEHVLAQLSYQQVQIVDQHRITELSQLDLTVLLHILDCNWFEILKAEALSPGMRNFVKELQIMHARLSSSFPVAKTGGVQIWR